jgi:hypothetical protein
MPTTRKPRKSTLRALDDPETMPTVEQIDGQRQLLPQPFRPEAGRENEADGAPLSKFGAQFRETVARLQGVEPSEVPLGLVRMVEALNADTDENLAGLARPVAKHTEYGRLWSVQLILHAPLLLPWLINGRALRRLTAKLRHEAELLTGATDHPTLSLPRMHVEGPGQVLEMVDTQRELLGYEQYTGEQRDLVDSIASHGVLDPPDVVFTEVESSAGSTWTGQTAEGAQRLFADQLGMRVLSNRDVAGLATRHWLAPTIQLRDLRPGDLADLAEALTFPDSEAAAFFPGKDPRTWLATTAAEQPAAVAWQLMRTITVNAIIAVEPNSRARSRFEHPVAATVQELIRRYHVNGKSKANWPQADVDGVVAISLIDTFRDQDRITADDRAVWLGQRVLTWSNPLDGTGEDANLLASTVRLIACLTVQGATRDAQGVDGLTLVQDELRDNGVHRPGPIDRARMAVAQALMPLDLHNSGDENQISAALQALFRDPLLWRGDEHVGGNWTALIGLALPELEQKARAELAALPMVHEPTKHFGPAQRALGALGMTALIVNPAMLKAGVAVTRTGKGAGGKAETVSAADPGKIVARMLADEAGIDHLVAAIQSLVINRNPTVPTDEESDEQLTDFWLRQRWLGAAAAPRDDETPAAAYLRILKDLVEVRLVEEASLGEWLREATSATVVGEEDDEDDQDVTPLYESIGVPDELADRAREALRNLDEFFAVGKAYARAAQRFGR